MSTSVANLDVTQYVKVNSSRKSITLQSFRDEVRIALSNVKPSVENTVHHTLNGGDNPLQFLNIENDVWVLAMTSTSRLAITETDVVGNRDYYAEVAQGNIAGHSIATIQGENLDVDTSLPENLWCAGGLMVYPTSDEQWQVVSDSTEDNINGVGAQIVAVQYLDSSYNAQFEMVELNGVTPVQMVATDCYRSISVTVVQVGTSGSNQGLIGVTSIVSGNPRLCMNINYNISSHGFFTVPIGKTAYFTYGHSAIGKNKDAKIDIYITNGDNGIFVKSAFADLFQNSVVFLPKAPVGGFSEKTDIQFRCTTLNNNTDATAFLQILLVDNEN